MKIEILRISKTRRKLIWCKDFAAIRWPKGATDYLTVYTNSSTGVLVGRHVDGWTAGIRRPGVWGWNCFQHNYSVLTGKIIWCRIKGAEREDNRSNLAQCILATAGLLDTSEEL